jgi:hypothetical protein
MIIDQSALSGVNAYLTPTVAAAPPPVDLSGPNGLTGRSLPLAPGDSIQVSGIHLLIEADDLESLFGRQSRTLLSVRINKEMFPRLIDDPYSNRVHNIAGFEDFQRGTSVHMRVLDIDGVPTLVSAGDGACSWSSMIYPTPRPVTFAAAAWHMAASRSVPAEAFSYSLLLDLWERGRDTALAPSETVVLADPISPRRPGDDRLARFRHEKAAGAYRLRFAADVRQDSFVRERVTGQSDPESLGRPLLQAVNLLEPVDAQHEFHSLHELLLRCTDHELHWVPGAPLRRMTAMLDISATQRPGCGRFRRRVDRNHRRGRRVHVPRSAPGGQRPRQTAESVDGRQKS